MIRGRAQRGEAFAQQVMGVGYLFGSGAVMRDAVEARYWFQQAAYQGDRISQKLLGILCEQGLGGSQDYGQAVDWYRQAAEQGDVVSQSCLGTLYAEGRGVPRDPVRAYFWLSLAESSLPASEKGQVKEKLVGLARELTPQQLEQARAMARKGPLADFPAGEGRPAIPKPANQIAVHAISVPLPEGEGWRRRQVPLEGGGTLHEAERDLPNGNRVQIHVADYYGPLARLVVEIQMSGLNDTERLSLLTQGMDPFLFPLKGRQKSEWVKTVRGPQRRFAAACKERHEVREEAGDDGRRYLWQDWMFFCLDPVSHLLVQIDYAERYLAKGGKPSPGFSQDAAAFFDSVEVDSSPGVLGLRPVTEVPAAIILVEDRLYSDADRDDHPAAVVFSLDPGARLETLSALAEKISRLKEAKPRDPEEKAFVKYLTDGRPSFGVFADVPRSMSPTHRAFVTSAMVRRRLLPGGHLHREGGRDSFLLRYRLCATTEHTYGLGHVGIVRPDE